MEKEIAGKILSCLRNTSKYPEETVSSHIPNGTSQNNDNTVRIVLPDRNISSCTGYAFSQYIGQSVDGCRALNVEDCEEFNLRIFESRRHNLDSG